MPTWTISIVERPEAGDYAITQHTAVQNHTFYCKLPPDLMVDLRAPGDDPWRGVKWRRSPDQLQNAEVYFNAGDRATLKKIGGRLFEALFTMPPSPLHPQGNSLGDVLMNDVGHAANQGQYLSIALDLSRAPALVAVPWEAMFLDVDGGRFLATDATTNLIRVLPLTYEKPLPPPVDGPLRLLSVISNPFGDLDVDKERAKIESTLGPIQVTPPGGEPRAAFTLLPAVTGATRARLRNAIRDHKPHILHYSGHGVSGAIALEKDGKPGEADLIDTDALRQIVQNDPPWLTFLNSCEGAQATPSLFGGTAQGLLANNVPFVVAMQFPISDKAAILFADEFYRALAGGQPVVQAISRGRSAIATEDDLASELCTPVLYSSGRADTIAMVPAAPAPSGEAAAPPPSGSPKKWIVVGGLAALLAVAAGWIAMSTLDSTVEKAGVNASAPPEPSGEAPASLDDDRGAAGDRGPGAGEPGSRGPTASMGRPPLEAFPDDIAPAAAAPSRPIVKPRKVRRAVASVSPPVAGGGSYSGGYGYGYGYGQPTYGGGTWTGSESPPPPPPPPSPLPPPPPPPPAGGGVEGGGGYPAPAAPAPVSCNPGPYLVFFDWNATTPDAEAAPILDNVAAALRECPGRRLVVTGHADGSGTAGNNLLVSQRRATEVQMQLAMRGLSAASIETAARGETDPRVPTADDVREVQNRRVEIVFEAVTAPTPPIPPTQEEPS